jgi:hypothetical protein
MTEMESVRAVPAPSKFKLPIPTTSETLQKKKYRNIPKMFILGFYGFECLSLFGFT